MTPQTQTATINDPPLHPTILIVDDHTLITQALTALLTSAGYQIRALNSGLAALELVKSFRPDAALLDIHLTDINGLVLTQKLRETLGPEIPLIILSGDTSKETLNSLSHVGATYFLPKPVQSAQILERLQTLINPTPQ